MDASSSQGLLSRMFGAVEMCFLATYRIFMSPASSPVVLFSPQRGAWEKIPRLSMTPYPNILSTGQQQARNDHGSAGRGHPRKNAGGSKRDAQQLAGTALFHYHTAHRKSGVFERKQSNTEAFCRENDIFFSRVTQKNTDWEFYHGHHTTWCDVVPP